MPTNETFDVLLYDQIGGAFSASTVNSRPTGGGELHLVQLAEALTRRGHRVVVANGVSAPVEENGVRYVPNAAAPPARVVVVNRYSPNPPVARERTVVHAIDPFNPAYERHRGLLLDPSVSLVAVSRWAAKTFQTAGRVHVIPPMLDPIVASIKDPNLFVFASAWVKGGAATLALWRELKARHMFDLADARLEFVSPGYGPPDITELRATPDCWYVGHVTPGELRAAIARAAGLFHVSTHTETFACVAAFAEASRTRAHILCRAGLGGIPEALTNTRLLTEDREQFEADFLTALDSPDNPQWYAEGQVPDRSPDALAVEWETALRLS